MQSREQGMLTWGPGSGCRCGGLRGVENHGAVSGLVVYTLRSPCPTKKSVYKQLWSNGCKGGGAPLYSPIPVNNIPRSPPPPLLSGPPITWARAVSAWTPRCLEERRSSTASSPPEPFLLLPVTPRLVGFCFSVLPFAAASPGKDAAAMSGSCSWSIRSLQ